MYPQKIKGVYTISKDVSDVTAGFTFTGADRNTVLHAVGITGLWNLKDIEDRYNYRTVHPSANNAVNVLKARLRCVGAECLRAAMDYETAARVDFGFYDDSSLSNDTGDIPQIIFFHNFNVWEDVKIKWTFPKAVESGLRYVYIGVNEIYMWIDDYNVQTAYVGETFKVYLDLVIDTAGMLIDYSQEVV